MTGVNPSALLASAQAAGGRIVGYHELQLVRHFGDPATEYLSATRAAAVFDRSHRARMHVAGREPARMLEGILTGVIPGAPTRPTEGVLAGAATYHAVLTHKGKMVTDLRCYCIGDERGERFLLDVPVAGAAGLRAHLARFLPPRFARVEDVSATTAAISVTGPEAAPLLSRLALGLRVEAGELSGLAEGEWRALGDRATETLVVARSADVWPEAYDVLGPPGPVVALWSELRRSGATPAGLGVWTTLRVEAGRPAFGTDMDESTIPVEANIDDRAIDHTKGCYTGQEVIVRIRDRGHVNRKLTLLHLGDVPTPGKGTELFVGGEERAAAVVTSAVSSPRFEETIALAYVRRGVEGTPRPR
jgi:folate-binding protein YgfZ